MGLTFAGEHEESDIHIFSHIYYIIPQRNIYIYIYCPLCGLEDDISTTWVSMRVFYGQPIEGLLTENPHRALKGEKLLLAKLS